MGAYLCKDAEHAKQAKQENNENAMLPASEKLKNQEKDVVVDAENPDIPFADATGDEDENVVTEKSNEVGKVVNDYNKSSVENQESPGLLTEAITVDIIKNVENAPSEEEEKVVDKVELAHEEIQSPKTNKENDLIIEDSVAEAKEIANETTIDISNELEVEPVEKSHEKCDIELDNQKDESELPFERNEIKTEEILAPKNVESEETIHDISVEFDTVVESHDVKLEEKLTEDGANEIELQTSREHVDEIEQTTEESEQINYESALEIDKIVQEHEELQHQFLEDVEEKEVKLENSELEIIEKEDDRTDEVEKIETFSNVPISCEDEAESEALISEHKENNGSSANFSDIKDDSTSNADEMILEPEFVESEKESSPEMKELEVCDSNLNDDETIVDETTEKESVEIKELEEVCDSNVETIVDETNEKESSEIKELEACNSIVEAIVNEEESEEIKELEEVCDSNVETIVDEKESSEIKELEACDSVVEAVVNEEESVEIKELEEVCDSNVEAIADETNEKESLEIKELEEVCDSNDEVVAENPIEFDEQNIEKVEEEVSKGSLLINEEHPSVEVFEKQEFEVPELAEIEEQKEQDFIPNESTPELFETTEQEKVESDAEPTCDEVENEPIDIQNDNAVLKSISNEEIVESAANEELLTENKIENVTEELSETKDSIDEKELVENLESNEESVLDKFSENSIVDIDLSTQHISTNGNMTSDAHESDDQSISNEIEIENGVEDVKDEELKKMVSDAVDEIMGDAKSQVQHIVESPSSKDSPINVLES